MIDVRTATLQLPFSSCLLQYPCFVDCCAIVAVVPVVAVAAVVVVVVAVAVVVADADAVAVAVAVVDSVAAAMTATAFCCSCVVIRSSRYFISLLLLLVLCGPMFSAMISAFRKLEQHNKTVSQSSHQQHLFIATSIMTHDQLLSL